MKRSYARLALFLVFTLSGSFAMAANSTNGAPSEAEKNGSIAGDPLGAIRALGGTGDTGFKQGGAEATIPHLGGSPGIGRVDGTPAGTTGPR